MFKKFTKCDRCSRKRLATKKLLLPVSVITNYETRERTDFEAGSIFCSMCWHSLLAAYGGDSEGSRIVTYWNGKNHLYFRESDKKQVI